MTAPAERLTAPAAADADGETGLGDELADVVAAIWLPATRTL